MAEVIDVDHIANLAKLSITEDEKSNFQNDMNEIVNYVNMLSELDVSNVEATIFAGSLKNVWRTDLVENSKAQDSILRNVPDTIDELIKVPQVIVGDDET